MLVVMLLKKNIYLFIIWHWVLVAAHQIFEFSCHLWDFLGFPDSSFGKESTCNAGDPGSIPGSGRSYVRDRLPTSIVLGFPGGSDGKRIHLQCRRPGFDPCVGKIPWKRAWQSTPLFLPGESQWTEETGGLQSMGSQKVRHD